MIKALRDIVGTNNVLDDQDTMEFYSSDQRRPKEWS